ncbi:hypothetical protein HPB50_020162 [Hyalomma asiaticum]|uniref:Uncharacterized protein n=1 Tax=Hyalomma asiaticum TaxID=266040 RepID=A0ACB7TKL1_HYAAI|nr:hypothetical protein HPB50_020162 [Hyalomma asiaticum]
MHDVRREELFVCCPSGGQLGVRIPNCFPTLAATVPGRERRYASAGMRRTPSPALSRPFLGAGQEGARRESALVSRTHHAKQHGSRRWGYPGTSDGTRPQTALNRLEARFASARNGLSPESAVPRGVRQHDGDPGPDNLIIK